MKAEWIKLPLPDMKLIEQLRMDQQSLLTMFGIPSELFRTSASRPVQITEDAEFEIIQPKQIEDKK